MLGILINRKEAEELINILKKEMDELLYAFSDERIHFSIKRKWKKNIPFSFHC